MNTYYITGTSRGLGHALAVELLKDRTNNVYGIGRTRAIDHDRYGHFDLDLREMDAVRDFDFRLPRGTRRAVLINNAGVVAPVAPVGRLDNQALVDGFTVNLVSPAVLMNNFIRHTAKRNAERLIINISSGAGRYTIASWAVYCATKAGLDMFSEVLHSEQPVHHPKRPVRIFSIAPGVMDTDMQQQIRTVSKKDFDTKERFIKMQAEGLLTPADQTARTILKIIAQPEKYSQVCLDIRDIN